MEEFWSFIEEGRIVFVAFDDEGARGPQMKAGAEIFRYASDEEGWLKRGVVTRGDLINPREHAGSGGLAMRACDDERFAAGKEFFVEQRGHGRKRNPFVEDVFNFGITARERIADDDEIGRRVEVRFGVRLENRNAERTKQVAHGRIGGAVGARDAMSLQLKEAGERGHRGAADTGEVNVTSSSHAATAGCRGFNCGSEVARSSACTPKVRVTFWRET